MYVLAKVLSTPYPWCSLYNCRQTLRKYGAGSLKFRIALRRRNVRYLIFFEAFLAHKVILTLKKLKMNKLKLKKKYNVNISRISSLRISNYMAIKEIKLKKKSKKSRNFS